MTPGEARRAADASGADQQDWNSRKSWSLAELFNKDVPDLDTKEARPAFGFGRS